MPQRMAKIEKKKVSNKCLLLELWFAPSGSEFKFSLLKLPGSLTPAISSQWRDGKWGRRYWELADQHWDACPVRFCLLGTRRRWGRKA